MRKILKYHPEIDMQPLFEWDAEGEQTFKALPYVVDWFERAKVAVAEIKDETYGVEERKLSAIFQFARAMPLFIVSHSVVTLFDRKMRQQLEMKNAELEAKIAELTQKKLKRHD